MPKRSRVGKSTHSLGESWVVDNNDDSDYDESSSSSEDQPANTTQRPSSTRGSRSEAQPPLSELVRVVETRPQDSNHEQFKLEETQVSRAKHGASDPPNSRLQPTQQETPRRRSTRTTSRTNVGQELIMPSIHEDESSYSPKKSKSNRSRSLRQKGEVASRGDSDLMTFLSYLKPPVLWLLEIVGYAFSMMKVPLGFLLALWLMFGLLVFTKNLIFRPLPLALTPLCRIPGSSLIGLPMCKRKSTTLIPTTSEPPQTEFPKIIELQSRFEDMLAETPKFLSLPYILQHSRWAVQSIRMHVKYSSLKFKDELQPQLDDYIDAMDKAADRLTVFDSQIGRTVDKILTSTRATQRELISISEGEKDRGAVRTFIADKVFGVFLPAHRSAADQVLDVYIGHTDHFAELISRLLDEAQATEAVVKELDRLLEVIYDTTTRNEIQVNVIKSQILSEIWTMVGGNKDKLSEAESEISLLKQVDSFRQSAFIHVSDVILRLRAIRAELDQMKQRILEPKLARHLKSAPINLQLEEIDLGLKRLEGVTKAQWKSKDRELNSLLNKLQKGGSIGGSDAWPQVGSGKRK